jgi:phage-related minor tail protein
MQDNFALNLAVGVKDLYSRKIDELEAKTADFKSRTKDLQKTVADVQAYRQAETAMEGLSQKQAALASELDDVSKQKKALATQVDKLKKSMSGQGKEALEGKKALNKLEKEIISLEDKEGDLRAELASTTAEQDQNLTSLKKLSRGLSDAGLDTRDLTGELKKLEKELGDVSKAEKKSSGMSLGAGLAGGAAVAGAGAFVGTLARGVYEYDSALSHLAATTTLTKEQAEAMKPALTGVYVRTGKTVQEIAPALQLVVQQLGLTGDAATDAVMALMEFSNVHPEMDTTTVVKAAGQAKSAWGLSTRETLDLISTITEQAGDKADDLLDTFWEYGPTMREAGLSAQQFSAMLISGAQAGAMNFDKIADSVKEAWKARISDVDMWDAMMGSGDKEGSIDEILGRFGMEEAGARIKGQLGQLRQGLLTGNNEMKSEAWGSLMTQMSALYERDAQAARNITEQIFGTQGSEDMTAQVLGAMGKGLQGADAVMAGSMGASSRQFAETLTLVDHLGQSWRSTKSVFTQGAGDIAKSLAPVGKALAVIASGVAAFAKEHPGVAKFVTLMAGAVIVVGGLAAGLAAVGFVVSGISTGLAAIGPVLAGLATGFSVAGKAALFLGRGFMALAMNPVGAVIMAVAGAAFLVWKYWDEITEGVKTAFGWISKLGGYLASGLKMAWDFSPLGMLWNMGRKVVDFFSNIDLSESGAKLLKTLASGITSAVTAPFRALKGGLSKLRNLLPFSDAKEGPLSSLTESGRKVLETMGTGIKAAGPGLAKTAKGAIAGTAAALAVGVGGIPAGAAVPDGVKAESLQTEIVQTGQQGTSPVLPDLLGRAGYAVSPPQVEALQRVGAQHAPSGSQAGREVTVNLTFSPVVTMDGGGQSGDVAETLEQALSGQSVEMMTALERAVTEIMERYDQRAV